MACLSISRSTVPYTLYVALISRLISNSGEAATKSPFFGNRSIIGFSKEQSYVV